MPDDRKFSTEKLDDAMKELIDICQQYNDKISHQKISQPTMNKTTKHNTDLPPPPPLLESEALGSSARIKFSHNGHREFPKLNRLFDNANKGRKSKQAMNETKCDIDIAAKTNINEATTLDKPPADSDRDSRTSTVGDSSIDRLQQNQCEIQKQLDEVLELSRNLDLKQKRKLSSLVEGAAISNGADDNDSEEDIELIEFRQIENELRVSELNRQLSKIQEQLRLKLYRRLSSRTSSESFNSARESGRTPPLISNNKDSLKRRNSAQTDESTPSTSSCSDEPTASSSISKSSIDNELASQLERCNLSREVEAFALQQSRPSGSSKRGDYIDGSPLPTHDPPTAVNGLPSSPEKQDAEKEDLEIAFDRQHNYEVLVPTSSLPQPTSNNPPRVHSYISACDDNNIYTNIMGDHEGRTQPTNGFDLEQARNYHAAFNGLRVCPANNDLERIEEDEEDDNEPYCSSEQFRKVYETKISPIMLAAATAADSGQINGASAERHLLPSQVQNDTSGKPGDAHIGGRDNHLLKQSDYSSPRIIKDRRFNPDNVNSAKRGGNRPLTMYLPKPDEEIDLIETVQALGHDLDILSTDIQFTPSTARGYLYKSCSNNNKKWLKRYFHFDRQSKVLSYYENEEQLVKKSNSPRSTIPFDEIGDVYVDHRLNELNEKQKGSKRKSYVFVLATTRRKYLLASPKPEAMRAWIDVLFTAAKANDYFQQVGNDDESLSFNYNSFTGE